MKVKAEDDTGDARMADDRPTYRSWKKKYRKMRIVFDQKMHEGEELHKLEQKALATARRLAIQHDRLLDLLLDVNNSPQIPPDKRIDLSLDPPSGRGHTLTLDIDRPSTAPPGPAPVKSYKKLLQEVPHPTFASAAERFPGLLADLSAGRDSPADPAQGQAQPPTFLTADDIDNYLWEIDSRLASERDGAVSGSAKTESGAGPTLLPTLAPLAQHAERATNPKDAQRDFALRNPTSVYNWLRKHAPKTFLQDAEQQHHDNKENGGDDHHHGPGSGRRGGGAKGERAARGTGSSARSKRASASAAAAHSRAAAAESLEDLEDELAYGGGAATPSTLGGGGGGGGKGKRKRAVDDDPGYRPKGGSSRPAKKKRKSEGPEKTPTVKGARKSDAPRRPEHDAGLSKKEGDEKRTPTTAKGPRKSDMPRALAYESSI